MSPDDQPLPPLSPQPARSHSSIWLPALTAAFLVLGCFAIYQSTQIHTLGRDLATHQKDLVELRTTFATMDAASSRQIADLRGQLASTQKESLDKVTEAQTAVRQHTDSIARKLEKKQAETKAALDAELNQVKESTTQTSTQLAGVSTDVSAVKSDVSAVRTDVASTKSELGVMSGLIATNSKEIDLLRQLGERNIFEFTLTKSSGLTKVGDIRLQLGKVNVRRNQYTLTVNASDKLIEKKDKSANEPVQFYVLDKARQPYEIVVNEIGKNSVKGYLATPKVTTARN